MNTEEFDKILNYRLEAIGNVIGMKSREYAQGGDRLFNFRSAARINGCTMEQALWGMATKHLVSVQDLVEGRLDPDPEMVNEKIGDMINYLILLEAVLKEVKE